MERRKKMRKIIFMICLFIFASCVLCLSCGYAASEETDKEMGRYQIYPTDKYAVLLDTKTGKLWKLNVDISGKIRAEGVTVEGLAHTGSDLDYLNAKISKIDLDQIPEKNRPKCKEALFDKFSYALDTDKINEVLALHE
jgi:hypothetical protein